ncbi:MAG: hypothetical protein M3Z24_13815 [Chloroflexota bacterium]|nr:hypothetical protein [Chloroflexota bacterium]
MIQQFPMLMGALRYEFRMQIHRRALWLTFIIITVLIFIQLNQGSGRLDITIPAALAHYPLLTVIAGWAFDVNTYLPLCIGALLADRLPRDRRTKVDELFTTMPATLNTRLIGKYLGSMLATLIPMFLVYAGGIAYILYLTHNIIVLPLALEVFAVIALPGVLFISAFSIACPVIIWVPLYQFLFICYWLWGTLWFHKELFNISRSILSPIGLYIAYGFYELGSLNDPKSPHGDPGIHSTPLLAVESTLLLIGIAILVMFVLERYIKWQQAHR